jgi:2-polyprenyl-3-methyl-5-hydroxy-6-metoxy-1,4-benzoquinol methylase
MKCRHCDNHLSFKILDLGLTPPSNDYVTEEKLNSPHKFIPLRVMVCEECWLVQTQDYARSDDLFNDTYAYFSSTSHSWLKHAQNYVEEMQQRFGLNHASLMCEIASNDGYLLQYVQAKNIPCFGIEPTKSTANAARDKGIEVIEAFFGEEKAIELKKQGKQADLIAANNVLAHVPDINDFVKGFAILLKEKGVATFEFPHLYNMIALNQFDTVYHEHYSYLSLTVVEEIFTKNGLSVFDVEEIPTHGGSLRVFAQRADTGINLKTARLKNLREKEEAAGIKTLQFYATFQAKAENIKDTLLTFLLAAQKANKKVAGYGAAAKGNTLLNFAGMKPDLIAFVVDNAPSKQGKYLPGSLIPIVSEAKLIESKPDYIIIFPWNIKREIAKHIAIYNNWDAKIVTFVPELEIM